MQTPRPEACPRCGGTDIVRIVYGLPGPDLMEKADAGEVALGGCCVGGDDPTWFCRGCDGSGPEGRDLPPGATESGA